MNNLRSAYQLAGYDDFYDFNSGQSQFDLFLTAKSIVKKNYDLISFIDHFPHPLPLLKAIFELTQGNPPAYRFHVYGDFTLNLMDWEETAPYLREVDFICASERQVQLVRQFVEDSDSVRICPFACDKSFFSYSEEQKQIFKRQYNFQDEDSLLLYTGRLSPEKNIAFSIEAIAPILEKRPNAHYVLAGKFDDLGPLKFGQQSLPGQYEKLVKSVLSKQSRAVQNRIHFLGNLSAHELIGAYSASQAFVSFSLYHDEDFGMSPVESLLCGTPCVLTDWGGYASFKGPHVLMTPAQLKKTGYHLDGAHIQSQLDRALDISLNETKRNEIREEYCARFSIEQVRHIIEKLNRTPALRFKGFTSHLEDMSRALRRYRDTEGSTPIFASPFGENPLYLKSYLPYLGETYG